MNSKLIKIVLIVLAALIGISCVYAVLINLSFFNVDEIVVSYTGIPSSFLPETERSLSKFYGNNLVGLKTSDVERTVLSQNVVDDVSVSKFFPKKLIVDIKYRDFPFRVLATDNSGSYFYLSADDRLVEVSEETYYYFANLSEVEINADYSKNLVKNGLDEGFRQLITMLGQCTSKDLITCIKYYENNRKTFGSLELDLELSDTTLTVKDPVTPQRLDEALVLIVKQVNQMGGGDYVLYGSVLDRKG